ncbi:PadR family transcriptional regulator [Lacticaseibacillus casei 21/1]|nr:PadR family transcriptional regulator [Lacticaseibacillus casei 21/1]
MQPSSQMLKGILEGAILQIIQQGDIYGYGLHEQLGALGFGDIPEGTIYPLLLKLQKINQLWASGEHRKADRIENTIT